MTGRLVVTGTGRCGTRYASHLLRAAGVACGHEQVYTFRVARGLRTPDWGEFDADASWMAVPFLPNLRTPALLLVRHPLPVVRSMLSLGWFAEGQRKLIANTVDRHRPEVHAEATRTDKALALWVHWNLSALPYVREVVRFEDMVRDPAALLAPAEVTTRPDPAELAAIRTDPTRTNDKADKKQPTPAVGWGDFRPALARAARQAAEIFGYRV